MTDILIVVGDQNIDVNYTDNFSVLITEVL